MKLKLVSIKDEARGTKSFFWEPAEKFSFIPGQYFYYTLPKLNYPDERGETRHFTISSSPTEELLRLTTRIREQSGFKKTLAELSIGSEVEGQGPNGTYINFSEEEKGPHIFIAGGIGITPFRSILKYAIDKNLDIPFYLLYSNSDNDFVYKEELDEWASMYPNLKIKYFDTSVTGHLNKELVIQTLSDWGLDKNSATFWIVGPPPFINSLEDEIEKLKIPSEKVKSEKFTGY